MKSALTVAVVQSAGVPFDANASLERARRLAVQAADDGSRFTLFPEAFLGGYPREMTFGATVGRRSAEGREWYRRYHQAAIELDGPQVAELERISRDTDMTLAIGVIERSGGTLYCTALVIDPGDGLIGWRRKLLPTAAERVVWGQGDLSRPPVVPTRHGQVGVAICWENYMPLLRTYMYSQGVRIWCAPTADDRDGWEATMRHIALEGRCFVLSSNQFSRRSDYPEDYPLDVPPGEILSTGGSMIVDPFGQVLAGPERSGEAVLTATLDLDEIPRSQLDFDVVGHYSRGDLFTLSVSTESYDPVVAGVHPLDEAAPKTSPGVPTRRGFAASDLDPCTRID
ncbi:putative Aliphatic nitrilase [Frankia canadensis]|uniref:Putative Aliphatic nitrilase n=1 Tax=Frankia canadensis TaxID=1836972 RepID=A0A2I2KVR9_9ACTN|nr:carbon-nitrogen hydrolase family protein [Frankia canadensis]SNQ49746.1 putative Aliphatic nitrilase [Frankia canadensis]SOU57036.1 putative Aliphatic nitrilase [Frankia canadensis]